jgi:lauroyl/myristoyl acyltransferase
MALTVETITNSPQAIGLLADLAGKIPRQFGHRLAGFAATQIAKQRNSPVVRAVRANQAVLLGQDCSPAALDQAVRETLGHSARSIFDLYHYLRDLGAAGRLVVLDKDVEELMRRPEFGQRGVLLAGIHLSSFDLVLRWFCRQAIRPLVLTIPEPRGGRRTEYEMRRQMGMNLVPATIGGLRRALRHLQHGGAVATGIDHPVSSGRLRPHFFGRPAALPLHHVLLAARARVPVMVLAAMWEADCRYHVRASEPVEMIAGHDPDGAALRNAEAVLLRAEAFIRMAPRQWSVPRPVWPSATDLVSS